MRGAHTGWILAACALLGAATCSNERKDTAAAPANTAKPAAAGNAAPSSPPARPSGGTALKSFPLVDLGGLGDREKELFAQIANDEFCPCDCPMTLAACLQETGRCAAAPLMGETIARSIRDGMPPDMVREEVNAGFSDGYAAPKKDIVLDGYGSLGPASAPIVLVEFSDFECPHCKDASPLLKQFVKKFPGEVRLVFKHFPLGGHANARDAAIAVEAAGKQGKFWDMHDRVFENQMALSQEALRNFARQLALDMKKFEADMNDPSLAGRVEASRREGEALGIDSTPSIFVNGRRLGLRRTAENIETRIAMERVRGQGTCR